MIRKIALALIFLTSCSNIAYSEQARFIVGYFGSFESDTVSEEYFKNAKFSFANVKIGRGPASTIVLAYINDGVYEWRSADNIKIYTNKEILLRSSGFETDARYFYGFRRTDNGELYLAKIDQLKAGDSIQLNKEGDPADNYEDFEQGENFFEGRDVKHQKVYKNLNYEQYKWDNRSLLYYIDDDGQLVLKVNEDHTYPTGV